MEFGTNVSQSQLNRQPRDGGEAVALDIETVPLASALALPYPEADRTPPSNYKDPEKIAEWRRKDREAWEQDRIKQYSLSPLYGRVVAIGFCHYDDDDQMSKAWLVAPTEAEERKLLQMLWKKSVLFDRLVTWNGLAFDMPFLMVRSAILGVACPWGGSILKRYDTKYHYDVKAVVTQWSTQGKGSFGDWLAAFGIEAKTAHGSEVYGMSQRGEYHEIAQYAAEDAERTLKMYERVWPVFD